MLLEELFNNNGREQCLSLMTEAFLVNSMEENKTVWTVTTI